MLDHTSTAFLPTTNRPCPVLDKPRAKHAAALESWAEARSKVIGVRSRHAAEDAKQRELLLAAARAGEPLTEGQVSSALAREVELQVAREQEDAALRELRRVGADAIRALASEAGIAALEEFCAECRRRNAGGNHDAPAMQDAMLVRGLRKALEAPESLTAAAVARRGAAEVA